MLDRDPDDGCMVIFEDDSAGEGDEAVLSGGRRWPHDAVEAAYAAAVRRSIFGPQNHDVEGARLTWRFLHRQRR